MEPNSRNTKIKTDLYTFFFAFLILNSMILNSFSNLKHNDFKLFMKKKFFLMNVSLKASELSQVEWDKEPIV